MMYSVTSPCRNDTSSAVSENSGAISIRGSSSGSSGGVVRNSRRSRPENRDRGRSILANGPEMVCALLEGPPTAAGRIDKYLLASRLGRRYHRELKESCGACGTDRDYSNWACCHVTLHIFGATPRLV